VNARFLLLVFDSVYALALAAWIGSLLFSSFGLAPVIATMPGNEARGGLFRVLFRQLSTWGVISGAIALPAYLGVPLSFEEYRGPAVAVQSAMILAVTLIMLYGANSLAPALDAAAAAGGDEGAARVERLRRRAVGLNVVALAAVLLVALVNRPAPRTAGIVEPSPMERARAQYEQFQRARSSRPQSPAPATTGGRTAP
jgi:uncharacterized membrane protein